MTFDQPCGKDPGDWGHTHPVPCPRLLEGYGTGSVHGGHAQMACSQSRPAPEGGSREARPQSWKGPRTSLPRAPDAPPAQPHTAPHPGYIQDLITRSRLAPPARAMLKAGEGGRALCRGASAPTPSQAGGSLPLHFPNQQPAALPRKPTDFLWPLCGQSIQGHGAGVAEGRSRAPDSPGTQVSPGPRHRPGLGQLWVRALPPSSREGGRTITGRRAGVP